MWDLLGTVLGCIGIIGFILVVIFYAGNDDDDGMWGGEQ